MRSPDIAEVKNEEAHGYGSLSRPEHQEDKYLLAGTEACGLDGVGFLKREFTEEEGWAFVHLEQRGTAPDDIERALESVFKWGGGNQIPA